MRVAPATRLRRKGQGMIDDGWDEDEAYLDALEEQEETFRPIKPRPRDRRRFDVAQVAEAAGLEAGFQTTYKPGRHEAGWLLSSLRPFYEQNLIADVLFPVKGGKEASVYCCAADPATGAGLLAAKVYRPRPFRSLRNDKLYREGRPVLTAEGSAVKTSDHRIMRALGKKTDFGVQVQHTSWLMHEYTTLGRLHHAGASVPRPLAAGENAVLMSYVGDAHGAAPPLSEVRLDPDEAESLFTEVLRNVELMLQEGVIHGDLSAYNILYWQGGVTLIDFPQVSDPHANQSARFLLGRDIARVCDYFARQGVRRDPGALLRDLWSRHVEAGAEARYP